MKIRIIISDAKWQYRLRVGASEPDRYFVQLRALDGTKLKHGPIAGSFSSFTQIHRDAAEIYGRLVAMLESNRTAVASGSFRELFEPDKQKLLTAQASEDLSAFGVRVAQAETFFIEPKLAEPDRIAGS